MAQLVSVIIPTYNRRERLSRVLEGLVRQSVPREAFEAVIVDDGSADGTAEWLAARTFPFALRALRQKNSGPSVARNTGIDAARGDLVLFLDDDVVPEPQLIEEHLRLHGVENGIVVIGPLASAPRYRQPWVAWEQEKLEIQYRAMAGGDWEPTYRQFWTGNASVAREHLVAAGGFDRTLRRNEDVELGYRLMKRNLRFRFNPRARGIHYAERSFASWSSICSAYGRCEVDLGWRIGGDFLLDELASIWRSLHPLTRWLVRRTLGQPMRRSAAILALRSFVRAARIAPRSPSSLAACGALANLLYWGGVAELLGASHLASLLIRWDCEADRGPSSSRWEGLRQAA
jgi:glycosyltransferase involved in cell wall biosynthesis